MASFLQLNTQCIMHVLSLLDASSLRNVLFACKRLHELASDTRYWRTDVHKTRALYYLTELCFDEKAKSSKAQDVIQRALKSVSDIRMLSDKMYNDIFKGCGPVVAKLFKMIKNTRYDVESGHPRETCSTETNSFEIHLPSGRKMNITGSHFNDAMGNYDREITITVNMEGKKYTCYTSGNCHPTDAYYFPEEIAESLEKFESLREPFSVIYKEITETHPPLGPSFFYWFANIDWTCPSLHNSTFGEKFYFKNTESNKMAVASKSEMKKLRQATCNKWMETMEDWKNMFGNKHAAEVVVESVGVLVKRSAEEVLKSLNFDLDRISNISYFMGKYRHEIVKLMIRSTIFNPHPGKWNGSVADKYVEEFIDIRTNDGLVAVAMNARNDGSSYPYWFEFTVDLTLPRGQKYSISSVDRDNVTFCEEKKRILSNEFFINRSEMSKLQALTDIFQEKVNAQYVMESPQLTNAFVFSYLVCATEFNRYSCDPDYFPKKDLNRLRDDLNAGADSSDDSS